jgi:hypothetical protein
MGRVLTYKDSEITSLLNKLADKTTESDEYADTMYKIGMLLGRLILPKIKENCTTISLASTVEDADYLGKGIIDVLEGDGNKVLLTVFWNKRFNPDSESDYSVAPIIKEFHEKGEVKASFLIIIKSIISSSCVVRTNLTRLIEASAPDQILVVAPVLLKGAIKSLEDEFDEAVSSKFEYLYFAEDDSKTQDGMVEPGIGGDIYMRLGFEGQNAKNSYIPKIVKERRAK